MDPQNLINQFSQQFGNGDAGATQVNVVSISANALAGITTAIAAQNKEFQKLEQQMKDLQNSMSEENRKARQSEITSNTNEERRQRAARAAVMGKIDKGFSATELALDGLKNTLSTLKNILIENFKRSIGAFQDFSKELRKANLTREEKSKYQQYTTAAQQMAYERYGIKLMGSEINDMLAELIKSNKDVSVLEDEQRTIYSILRKQGMSEERAYSMILGVNKENAADLQDTILSLSDTMNVGSRVFKELELLTPEQIRQMGGMREALKSVTKSQEHLAKYRSWLNADAAAEMGSLIGRLNSVQLETMSESDAKLIAAFQASAGENEEALLDRIASSTREELDTLTRIVGANGGFSPKMQQALTDLATVLESNPAQAKVDLRGAIANAEANEQNTAFGRFAFGIDSMTRKFLGGVLGPIANLADEWFGDQLRIEEITSNGFKWVISLLGLIATGKFFSSSGAQGALSNIVGKIGSKAFGALKGASGIALKAAGPLAAIGTLAYGGKEIYDIVNSKNESFVNQFSSQKYIKRENDFNTAAKSAKAMSPVLKTTIAAAVGLAAGPLGLALAPLTYAAVGLVTDKISDGLSNVKTDKLSANLKDLDDKIEELERISKHGNEENKEWANKQIEELKEIRKNTAAALAKDVSENFSKQNEEWVKNNTANTLRAIQSNLSNYNFSELEKKKAELEAKRDAAITSEDRKLYSEQIKEVTNKLAEAQKTRAAAIVAARYSEGMSEGEDLAQFIARMEERDKRLFNVVRFSALGTAGESAYSASLSRWITEAGHSGLFGNDTYNKLETALSEAGEKAFATAFVSFAKSAGFDTNTNVVLSQLQSFFNEYKVDADRRNKILDEIIAKGIPLDVKRTFATGGIVNKATSAIIGEDGKEAVLPLTKPGAMAKVLSSLSNNEKLTLIKSLLSSSGPISIFDFIKALLGMAFNKPPTIGSENTPLSQTALSKNIIAGAAAQRGHSYAEMVCNQLVEAALNYAGFKPPTTGSVYRHFNHSKMHIVLNDPVNGIDPNDPALLPGMILFSHPFTAAEAMHYNGGKNGPRKAGDPGHMGIYAGNGLWWNSTSSKNTVDYSSGKGIRVTDSNKGFGVALTKPFRTGTYKLYAAGYYDGMFDSSAVSNLPSTSADNIKSREYAAAVNVASAGLLSESDIQSVEQAAGSNASYIRQYIEQANKLLNSSNRGDIVTILLEIARYLKGIASAPANKPKPMAVGRPIAPIYQ